MSILAEFSIVPIGKGTSLSPVIARVMKIVSESGVPYKVNPMGTVLEGEWGPVMDVIRKCHEEAIGDSGRVLTTIRIDDRRGSGDRMGKKVESVERKIGIMLNK